MKAQVYGTTGLTDTLAIDVAALLSDQGKGWGRNVFTGNEVYKGEQQAVRSKLLWQPDSATKVVAAIGYNRNQTPQSEGYGTSKDRVNIAGTQGLGFYDVDTNVDGIDRNKQTTASLNASHDFGSVKVASATGYENTSAYFVTDNDNSRINRVAGIADTNLRSISQELQLLSSGHSAFEWIVGAFYYHSRFRYYQFSAALPPFPPPPAFTTQVSIAPLTSYAAFGQGTLEVLPGTKVTAGLRYTIDKRSISSRRSDQSGVPTFPNGQKREDKKLTYRFALSEQITNSVMAFGSVSRGFKSGLFSSTVPTSPAVKPATLDAYEIGLKADLLDRRLRVNLSAFINNYKGVQLQVRTPDNSSNVFINAAKVRSTGFEGDVTAVVSREFSLNGGFAYLDSHYRSFDKAPCIEPTASGIGNMTRNCDVSGNRTVQSPKLVVTIGGNYTVETSIGELSFSATDNHNSGYYFDPFNRVRSHAHELVNGFARWTAPSKVWSLTLWVNNALNKKFYSNGQFSNFGDLLLVSPPRTYGVTAGMKF